MAAESRIERIKMEREREIGKAIEIKTEREYENMTLPTMKESLSKERQNETGLFGKRAAICMMKHSY